MVKLKGPPIRMRTTDVAGGGRIRSAYGELMQRCDVHLGDGWHDCLWNDLVNKQTWNLYDKQGNMTFAALGRSEWAGNGPAVPAERGCVECHKSITPALASDPPLEDAALLSLIAFHYPKGDKTKGSASTKAIAKPIGFDDTALRQELSNLAAAFSTGNERLLNAINSSKTPPPVTQLAGASIPEIAKLLEGSNQSLSTTLADSLKPHGEILERIARHLQPSVPGTDTVVGGPPSGIVRPTEPEGRVANVPEATSSAPIAADLAQKATPLWLLLSLLGGGVAGGGGVATLFSYISKLRAAAKGNLNPIKTVADVVSVLPPVTLPTAVGPEIAIAKSIADAIKDALKPAGGPASAGNFRVAAATVPRDNTEALQLLQLARSEGSDPVHLSIIGQYALDELDKLGEAGGERAKFADDLRATLTQRFNETVPIALRAKQ